MIELFEGVPGAGKTCYVIGERVLPWVKAGLRVYVCMRDFSLPLWAVFLGVPLETLQRQVTVLQPDEALRLHEIVEPQSKVFLDEAQNYFRSRAVLSPELLRWLEAHRHYGVDLVLTCQNYKQCTAPLTRLVEAAWKFRRMDCVGLSGRYFARLRGEVEDTEIIRTVSGKFDPRVYRFYQSYAVSGVKESRSYGSIWRSPKMAAAVLFLVAGGVIVFARPWVSGAKQPAPVLGIQVAASSEIPKMPPVRPSQVESPAPLRDGPALAGASSVVCIVGAFRVESGPWRYVTRGHGVLTSAQLSSLVASLVIEQEIDGVGTVFAHGLTYQPCTLQTERG
jgi:zona occludens toxin (predicted ATPase)